MDAGLELLGEIAEAEREDVEALEVVPESVEDDSKVEVEVISGTVVA